MPLPQTGATQNYAQLGISDKGRVIKGLEVCNSWQTAKRSGPRLLSTVP